MALFSSLSEKFNHIFSKLTKRGRLTELEIKEAMREVRIALLEADVNYMVAKDFVKIPNKLQKHFNVLEITVEWEDPQSLVDFVLKRINALKNQ